MYWGRCGKSREMETWSEEPLKEKILVEEGQLLVLPLFVQATAPELQG
jgi:hypothetical protein